MTEPSITLMDPRQLVWRCRRGVRELDVLLGGFLEGQYASLNQEQKLAFQCLLEEQDPLIMDWLFKRSLPSDPRYTHIINLLQHQAGL